MKLNIRNFFIFLLILGVFILLTTNYPDNRHIGDIESLRLIEQNSEERRSGEKGFNDLIRINRLIEEEQNYKISQVRGFMSGSNIAGLGIYKMKNECDTCTSFRAKNQHSYPTKYFMGLKGYCLKERKAFFIENGKYFLHSEVVEKSDPQDDGMIEIVRYDTMQIKVRYATDLRASRSQKKIDRELLIPLSPKTYYYYRIFFYSVGILAVLICLCILVIFPIRILYNIARGQPFSIKNIRYMNVIGWFLIIGALLIPLLMASAQLIFHDWISPGFYYPLKLIIMENNWAIMTGIVVLMTARAFKSGYQLQQEKDLTI